MKRRAYCSGPLFCPEEVAVMSDIASVLEENGFETFLPQRDGVEAFVMNAVNSRLANSIVLSPVTRLINKAIFAVDIYQVVERCDCLVFNMNGRVPDEGGVVEAAVAFAFGKPVVIYRSKRPDTGGSDGPMLHGAFSAFPVADEIEKIPGLLVGEMRDAEPGRIPDGGGIPPRVRKTVAFGGSVCRLLEYIQFLKPKNKLVS
ncbi:MAG: nucleoside 2-deoxyribosyltransferase [Actinobacteria bacterium]|nr:nucleoside 2-deoxyribosyltransferase [Actinomycetota bacterium]MCG2817765.1 nucleoside 2-deoxyribosyltransferase [Actinomycetes bacterium]MBU4178588.1 nucleoside 2-deoxyribosyltransferase [Actinomycetota bacterium]MBU4218010.1 nucleoside 2-deoxyribosyltransferase [Actinomycetota bacterium]MBU4358057.1 nucleoside 2-deoxyribosyltransferase [Actinomycetota bacterium]